MAASGQEPEGELRSNKDLVDYLSKVLKAKELQIETQQKTITDILSREKEGKDKLEKLEFLYELDPNKPLIKYRGQDETKPPTSRFGQGNDFG